MANIARLGVILGLSSSEFVSGIDNAKRKTKELEQTMSTLKTGAMAVGGALAIAAQQVMAFSDEIADTADAYQTTIGNILDLSEALVMSGGKAESAGRMMGQFANKVDEAANAGKQAQEAFQRIGISLTDLSNLSMDELFRKALEQISQIEDPIKRNAAAFDIFGKAVRGVDLTKLSDEMLHGAGATDKQKAAVRELADQYDNLHAMIFKAKLAFAEALAPAFKTAEINFGGMGKVMDSIINVLKKAAEGFVFLAGTITEVAKVGIKQMNDLGVAILAGLNPFDNKGFWETLQQRTAKSWQEFKDNMRGLAAVGTENPAAPPSGGGRDVKKSKDSQLDQLLKELATLDLIEAKYKAQLDEQAKGVQLRTNMMYMTVNESQIAERMYELDKRRAEQIGQLEDKKKIALETGADKRVINLLDEQIKKVNETTDAYKQQIAALIAYQQQLEQSYMGGFLYSYKKYQELAINNALVIQQSVDALFQGMTDALTKFIMTGKMNFRDFATAIIAEIVRIQVAAAASKLFAGVIKIGIAALSGALAGSGAATSDVTAWETGGAASDAGGNFGTANDVEFRASGGDVNAGSSYIVGENGPELFTPRGNGTIIPNNAMGNGGMTVNQNFNIQAIDPASFNEKVLSTIANNAKTVFSINKEGERQMGAVSFA